MVADMRKDVQEIFKMTPHDKQVMMFSATLSKEIRPVCKKFMQDVMSCGQIYLNFDVSLFIIPPFSMPENAVIEAPYTYSVYSVHQSPCCKSILP